MNSNKDTENLSKEISSMLKGVPSRNVLISFDDDPAISLEERIKEMEQRKQKKKDRGRER